MEETFKSMKSDSNKEKNPLYKSIQITQSPTNNRLEERKYMDDNQSC